MKHEPGYAYESEIDALIRKMRQEPTIEAERQRNWRYWWQTSPVQRDSANVCDDVQTQEIEHDMAYASRREQPQGGRK